MPRESTSFSPLSRMQSARRVKSPFSQSALFGFIFELSLPPANITGSVFEGVRDHPLPSLETMWRISGDCSRKGYYRRMIYGFGEFELDTERVELRQRGVTCAVEPQVFALLRFLIEHRDRM